MLMQAACYLIIVGTAMRKKEELSQNMAFSYAEQGSDGRSYLHFTGCMTRHGMIWYLDVLKAM